MVDAAPVNRCTSDSECGSGACNVEQGFCVGSLREPLRVGIEIVPASDPYGDPAPPVSFEPFDLNKPEERQFVLPMSVTVRGLLRHIGEPVSASITFNLVSNIEGLAPTRFEAQTFTTMRVGDESFEYAVQLLPSRVYDVTIQPSGQWRSKLPPARYRFQSPPAGVFRQDFHYAETLPRVQGQLIDSAGNPQPGLLVRAIDPVTGRAVSSTYTTASDPERPPGWFEIVLAPGTESWLFSINASSMRIQEGNPSPTHTVDPNVLLPDGDGLLTIQVPTAPQVITYGGFVEVEGSGGRGTPAALTFTAEDVLDMSTQVIGSFRAMVATSEEPGREGAFAVQLLPGTYDVVVMPASPELGIVRETGVRLVPEAGTELLGQTFQVPMRARYGGKVQTFAAEPMNHAQVRGQARGSTHGGRLADVAVYARSAEALADSDGQFQLPLDVGLYDVVVEPPSGTNWPWVIQRDVAIGASDTVLTTVVEVGAPVPLTGYAVFEEGSPVVRGEVRAYAVLDEGDGLRTMMIGRAQTDAAGRFTLLLPSSL